MAKFSITLLSDNGDILLNSFNSQNQDSSGLTFDENFNQTTTGVTLSFSMFKYVLDGVNKNENVLASAITYGSRIGLVDKNDKYFEFYINKITYSLNSENVLIKYSATDAFQYELSKINNNYSITSDSSSDDFLGVQTIDQWARKIISDCALSWTYVDIDIMNNSLILKDNQGESYNDSFSFSCSNCTALSAIQQLAAKLEFIVSVNFNNRSFGFIPNKNPVFKGYYINPNNNVQSLEISSSAENLATILNISGGKDVDDNEISLVPVIPLTIRNYIESTDWDHSVYSSDLYSSINNLDISLSENKQFIKMANLVPWLENKLINFNYFKDTKLLSTKDYLNIKNILENELRITNGHLIVEARYYYKFYEEALQNLNKCQMALDNIAAGCCSMISDYISANAVASTYDISSSVTNFTTDYNTYKTTIDNDKKLLLNIPDWDIFWNEKENSQYLLYNTLLENLYNFEKLWNSTYSDTTYGQYYYKNHAVTINDTNGSSIIQNCAEIAEKLSEYWNNAYDAALHINIYIPKTWNCFDLIDATSTKTPTDKYLALLPIIVKDNVASVNTAIVPTVLLKTVTQTAIDTDLDNKNFRYVVWKKYFDYKNIPSNYILVTEIHDNMYQGKYIKPNSFICNSNATAGTNYFELVEGQVTNDYYLKENESFLVLDKYACTISGVVYDVKYTLNDFWNNILISCMKNQYDMTDYYKHKTAHDAIWTSLYHNYPGIMLETSYNNTTAVTSDQLYKEAKAQFDVISNPVPSYSFGLIDNFLLDQNLYSDISISDQLRFNYTDNSISLKDELNSMLSTPLYIQSIDYSLRSDGDIKISVEYNKATDLMISRFARILNFA